MTHITEQTYIDKDHRIQLYLRTDSKAGVWQAKFRIAGQRKYKRVSTGCVDFDDAKVWAQKEFYRTELKVNEYGESITNYRFSEIANRWLKDRKAQRERGEISEGSYQRDLGTTNRYLIPFFGKLMVSKITQAKLDEFRDWRETYWVDGPGKDKPHKKKKRPKTNTIRQENISLRMILRMACELGVLRYETHRAFVWRSQSIGNSRRPHFDDAEWRMLTDHMRRNNWLNHKNERVAKNRRLLRDYVLILANTGMRVGEARGLKWKNVKWLKNADGGQYLTCMVDGKTGKRTVVCNANTEKYFERVKETTGHTKPNDWVWAKLDGSLQKDFSAGFRSLLEEVFGERNGRTLYSLRHTFATKKILHENVNLKILAERMGTSVAMIDKHYGHVDVGVSGKIESEKAERYRILNEQATAPEGVGSQPKSQ